MNILNLIAGNWARGPETRRFPDRQAPTPEYRGNVVNDPAKCVGCGICTQVCVSAAITLASGEGTCTWSYDPASCTFCGFCVTHCPVNALSQESDRGPSARRPGEQATDTVVEFPPCTRCGRPAPPFSEDLVRTAYGKRADELRGRARLCESCRRQATAEVMRKAFAAMGDTDRRNRAR